MASDEQDCRNTKCAFTSHTFHHGWHLMDKIVVTLNVHLHHIHFHQILKQFSNINTFCRFVKRKENRPILKYILMEFCNISFLIFGKRYKYLFMSIIPVRLFYVVQFGPVFLLVSEQHPMTDA